ncbi:helix-turn-helix domain-containing protein [Oceanobacillus sojae]|uniref:helix-turn-helix domain-containing protein n=1 Tax=Oceanobacillus sojae TaxID=582851 RepID=UPI0009888D24|nr:helix-turn-helix domain-containing protein [Oceanobacillus sojae]
MNNISIQNDERGLLPYPIIIAANAGEAEALRLVVKHYDSYIASLSMRKLRDEQDNTYWDIDGDMQSRLRSKLMQSVLAFKI